MVPTRLLSRRRLAARLRRFTTALSGHPIGGFAADRRGVSAIEFALVFPFMLLLYIGGYETSQVLSADRRVGHVGATVGDLVSQVSSVSAAEVENIFDASTALMSPFSTTNLKMTVSTVLATGSGCGTGGTCTKKVTWSKTRKGTAWAAGAAPPVTIPDSMLVAGQEVVVSQVAYSYTGLFTGFMKDIWGSDSISMSEIAYYRPRVSTTVTLK